MRKNKSKLMLIIIVTMCCVCCFSSITFTSAADDVFEKEIAAFPESYKPYLRQMHEKHPNWSFEPFETGLDWQSAVDNQYGSKSTIDNASAIYDIFKSKAADHYNYDKGTYKELDKGFAAADKLAIEFCMDPRNALNDYGIFMFEQLSFSKKHTVESVELVLKGTVMHNAKISYLDTKGKTINTDQKYSEVIYQAGKTYNVNPCYLASKIRLEVSGGTSGSVSGKHSKYPGYYNYYNIGAYDGADPVSNGLKYASSGTSYMRPWDSPNKSITGGAKFIADTYIGKGQFTTYLQKFNVNSDSSYPLYTHQYMTNVAANFSQVYMTYNSYKNAGLLEGQHIFSIPVFKNMPSEESADYKGNMLESVNQYAVTTTDCNIRSGPSTAYARITDSSGAGIKLPTGTKVKVLNKIFTDTAYYTDFLKYPIWYEIKFTYNSKSYTGYVTENYMKLTTSVNVTKGTYNIGFVKSDKDVKLNLVSTDVNVARVKGNGKIEFLKNGTVEILAYNSLMQFDRVLFNVTDKSYQVKNLSATSDFSSITATVKADADAEKYGFYLTDSNGKLVKSAETSKNTYTFKKLINGQKYTVYARCVLDSGEKYGAVSNISIKTKAEKPPSAPASLKVGSITTSSYKISWEKVSDAEGYQVYSYDILTDKQTLVGETKNAYMTISSLESGFKGYYTVKSYRTGETGKLYSGFSDYVCAATKPSVVTGLHISSFTDNSCVLSWDNMKNADDYYVYLVNTNSDSVLYTATKANECEIKELEEFTEYTFTVVAVVKNNTCTTQSEQCKPASVRTLYSPVTNLKILSKGYDSIKLSWSVKKDIDKYEILVFEGMAEKFSFKLETTKNSISVKSLNPFSEYRFIVRGLKNDIDGRTYYTHDSKQIKASTELAGVKNIKCSSIKATSYTLTWDITPNATSYNIYRRTKGKFIKLTNVKKNSFTDKSLNKSTKYYYKISAVKTLLGVEYESKLTSGFSVATTPSKVSSFKATPSTTSVKLTWKKVNDAACYNIYQYDAKTKKYKHIKKVTGTSHIVKGLKIGESYKFRIRAYIETSKGTLKGEYAYKTVKTIPGSISKVSVSAVTTTSLYLKWSEAKGANYYYVYKYSSKSKSFKCIGKTNKLKFKVTGLTAGKTEKYKILPVIHKNSELFVKGNYTSEYSFTTKPAAVKSLKISKTGNTSITLSWSKVYYADKYEVLSYNTKTKKYSTVATVTKNTCTLKNLKSKTRYYIKVRAVKTLNKNTYKGSLSSFLKVKTK